MTALHNLGFLVEALVDARDNAFRAAEEARLRTVELRSDRPAAKSSSEHSIFDDIYRRNSAELAREVALEKWAANALALSNLHLATRGEYGQRYEDQPSPYRTRPAADTTAAEAAEVAEGVEAAITGAAGGGVR